jgi:hypothetical protein
MSDSFVVVVPLMSLASYSCIRSVLMKLEILHDNKLMRGVHLSPKAGNTKDLSYVSVAMRAKLGY